MADLKIRNKISPCLWFDKQAEEAVKLYTSVFKNSKTGVTSYYSESGAKVSGMPEGAVMTITFEIEGQEFMALNGGPIFKFTEATSFMIDCKTQEEADYYYDKLAEGGEILPCGWFKDKFGLSWQINDTEFFEKLAKEGNTKRTEKVLEALYQMKKIDMDLLKKIYNEN